MNLCLFPPVSFFVKGGLIPRVLRTAQRAAEGDGSPLFSLCLLELGGQVAAGSFLA